MQLKQPSNIIQPLLCLKEKLKKKMYKVTTVRFSLASMLLIVLCIFSFFYLFLCKNGIRCFLTKCWTLVDKCRINLVCQIECLISFQSQEYEIKFLVESEKIIKDMNQPQLAVPLVFHKMFYT